MKLPGSLMLFLLTNSPISTLRTRCVFSMGIMLDLLLSKFIRERVKGELLPRLQGSLVGPCLYVQQENVSI